MLYKVYFPLRIIHCLPFPLRFSFWNSSPHHTVSLQKAVDVDATSFWSWRHEIKGLPLQTFPDICLLPSYNFLLCAFLQVHICDMNIKELDRVVFTNIPECMHTGKCYISKCTACTETFWILFEASWNEEQSILPGTPWLPYSFYPPTCIILILPSLLVCRGPIMYQTEIPIFHFILKITV